MRLLIFALLIGAIVANVAETREITHEDIKDAMLSLVHMMRENTEKLERHEARERQLGEQVKKTLSMLTKRMTVIDGLKTHLTKLDERMAGIEQLVSQKDERERIQLQKTTDALEELEGRLEGWVGDIGNKISEANNRPEATTSTPSSDSANILAKLNDTEVKLASQADRLETGINAMSLKLKEEIVHHGEKLHNLFSEIQGVHSRVGDVQNLIGSIRSGRDKPEDSSALANSISPIVERQSQILADVRDRLENVNEHIRRLPRIPEMQSLHNETLSSIQEVKHALRDVVAQSSNGIENRQRETTEETKDSLNALRSDLANTAERINQELQDLGKGQSVMVSMADHVLDTKKRVEYGVHQILLEVGDLVQAQGKNINNTLNSRFDGISNDIMDNQNGALANLTTKMEKEMNQVWRQINVMYQQMTESARALDKLHKQNEAYVNGTTATMGGMENKVGEITKRMTEVDENLNYLLGRLSLVTQEFNQIKTGLGTALDNIKASFKEVQEKANDLSNPGPHPLPETYKELDETKNMDEKPPPEIVSNDSATK